jgi:hypothetical protein
LKVEGAATIEDIVEDHADKSGVSCADGVGILRMEQDAKSVLQSSKRLLNTYSCGQLNKVEPFVCRVHNRWVRY